MKQFSVFVALCCAVASVSAAPRFLVIPLEDVEFVGEGPSALPVYQMPFANHRVARAIQEDQEPSFNPREQQFNPREQQFNPREVQFTPRVPVANRRQEIAEERDGGPAGIPGSFIGTINAANIPTARDNLASGSSAYSSPPQGSDYVDYGAYTGKHGAFGWYSDHPVLLFGHHH